MRQVFRHCALCYSSGAVGALAKGALVLLCTQYAITVPLGEQLASALRPGGFYARLVWGGLYALLFALPLARSSILVRGLTGALIVSVLQLVILPLLLHSGLHVLALSTLSLVLLNCVWGLVSVGMLHFIE